MTLPPAPFADTAMTASNASGGVEGARPSRSVAAPLVPDRGAAGASPAHLSAAGVDRRAVSHRQQLCRRSRAGAAAAPTNRLLP
jgi:hypothetical protein